MDKYKEALEKAKKLYEQGTITESLTYIFPELKESEDEQIKNFLIDYISHIDWGDWDFSRKQCIAWLEKQEEHNNSNVKDYNSIDPHFGKPVDCKPGHLYVNKVDSKIEDKQKPSWSERDEAILNSILSCIKRCQDKDTVAWYLGKFLIDLKRYEPMFDWLNSLKKKEQRNKYETRR